MHVSIVRTGGWRGGEGAGVVQTLCTLLFTVGQLLDTSQGEVYMTEYFSALEEIARTHPVAGCAPTCPPPLLLQDSRREGGRLIF